MEVKIYTEPKTAVFKDSEPITYDAVYLEVAGYKIEIKAVYKNDKKLFKYIVKECSRHEPKKEPEENN